MKLRRRLNGTPSSSLKKRTVLGVLSPNVLGQNCRATPLSMKKKSTLRSMIRRTPLLGSPKRVISPTIVVMSSSSEDDVNSSSDYVSCPLSLSFESERNDESDECDLALTVASEDQDDSKCEFDIGSFIDIDNSSEDARYNDFEHWSRVKLVGSLQEALGKQSILQCALEVIENAYDRRGQTLEDMKMSRIEMLRKRVEEANREAEQIPSPRSSACSSTEGESVVVEDISKKVVSGETLVRFAMEKESIEQEYKQLKKRYDVLQLTCDVRDARARKSAEDDKNVKIREKVVVKSKFPNLNVPADCITASERLRALLGKWNLLQLWFPSNRTEYLGRYNASDIEKWETLYRTDDRK